MSDDFVLRTCKNGSQNDIMKIGKKQFRKLRITTQVQMLNLILERFDGLQHFDGVFPNYFKAFVGEIWDQKGFLRYASPELIWFVYHSKMHEMVEISDQYAEKEKDAELFDFYRKGFSQKQKVDYFENEQINSENVDDDMISMALRDEYGQDDMLGNDGFLKRLLLFGVKNGIMPLIERIYSNYPRIFETDRDVILGTAAASVHGIEVMKFLETVYTFIQWANLVRYAADAGMVDMLELIRQRRGGKLNRITDYARSPHAIAYYLSKLSAEELDVVIRKWLGLGPYFEYDDDMQVILDWRVKQYFAATALELGYRKELLEMTQRNRLLWSAHDVKFLTLVAHIYSELPLRTRQFLAYEYIDCVFFEYGDGDHDRYYDEKIYDIIEKDVKENEDEVRWEILGSLNEGNLTKLRYELERKHLKLVNEEVYSFVTKKPINGEMFRYLLMRNHWDVWDIYQKRNNHKRACKIADTVLNRRDVRGSYIWSEEVDTDYFVRAGPWVRDRWRYLRMKKAVHIIKKWCLRYIYDPTNPNWRAFMKIVIGDDPRKELSEFYNDRMEHIDKKRRL